MSEIHRFVKRINDRLVEVVELCDPAGRPTRHYRGRVDGRGVWAGKKIDCQKYAIAVAEGRLPFPKED